MQLTSLTKKPKNPKTKLIQLKSRKNNEKQPNTLQPKTLKSTVHEKAKHR